MAIYGGQVQTTPYQAPDYGQSVAAARELAMTGAQGIAGMVGQVGDYFKQQGEKKKLIKKSDVQIDAALKLFPDLAPALQGYRDQLKDENLPLDERTAIADSISNVINMGIGEMRNAQSNLFKKQQLEAEADYRNRMATAAETKAEASLFSAKSAAQPSYRFQEYNVKNPITGEYEKRQLPVNPKTARPRDVEANRDILNVQDWYENKGGLAPEESELPPTSQVGSGAADLIASAQNINILPVGSKIPTASVPYDGRPAPNRYNNPGGAYPRKDLVQFGIEGKGIIGGGHPIAKYPDLVSGAAANMEHFRLLNPVGKTVGQMRKKWVYGMGAKGSLPISGLDENKVITQDDLNDLTFMSKWMAGTAKAEGFKGRIQPEELVSAFNLYQAGGYNKNAQSSAMGIDSSLAMGGDMTQQAMGTPQQKAEVARMIEEGQGMAMTQNIPQGAIPTDPSMATQQPQLPQQAEPKVNLRPGFTPVRSQANKPTTMMTAEQVQNLVLQGYEVNALPNADGTFMVSGVTVGGQPGLEIEQTPGGGFRLVQGAGVGGKYKQAAQERQKQQTSRSAMGVQDAYRALRKFDAEVMKGSGVLASSYRKGAQFLPGTPEHKVAQDLIRPLRDSIAKESIDAMRASSPSGAALGNSSDKDVELMKSMYGALEIETDPVVWRQNLTRFIEAQLDVIHGSPEQRKQLVQEGKLTKEQYFDIESQYPAFTMSATGETVPRQMDGVSPQGQPADDENARVEAILRQHGVIPK